MEIRRNRSIVIEAAKVDANRVGIKVSDNGPGISASIRNRVFEPFFTTKPEGQGTGLGLSFCQNVAASHNGTIEIDKAITSGTTISLELPIGIARVDTDQEQMPLLDRMNHSLRILVVDDETSLLDSLVEQLTSLGHSAYGCSNTALALESVINETFDIVLTDIRMPGMDGPAFYDEASANKPFLRDRFIFITGDSLNQRANSFIENTKGAVYHKAI